MGSRKYKDYFSCHDLLLLNSMSGATLLAGEDNLWKQVKRVNVAEVPDIINWVKPGEFLVTTGYPFKDNEEGLVNILPMLADKGVVALGLKPKRFIDYIPAKVVEKAKEINLPLIELGPMATFSDIVRDVMEAVLAKEMTSFSAMQRKIEKILDTLMSGGSIEDTLEMIEEQTKQIIFILDNSNDFIGTQKSIEFTQKIEYHQCEKIRKMSVECKKTQLTINGEIRNVYITPMNIGYLNSMVMVMIEEDEPLKDIDATMIVRICQVIALELKNSDAMKRLKEKYKNRFVYDWISNSFGNRMDVCMSASSYGYKLEPSQMYRVAMVNIFQENNKKVISDIDITRAKRIINRLDKNLFATLNESKLILILEENTKEETFKIINNEYFKLKDMLDKEKISFYVSEPKAIEDIPIAYKEAKNICKISEKCNIDDPIITYDKIGVFSILSLLPDNEAIQEYKGRLLDPIKKYDENHNSYLLDTLKVYFSTKCNARLTADRLFTHYNTISYRLERIKSILDLNIDDIEIQLQLQLALKLDLIKSESDKNG